jgi:hypothetical protein
MEQNAPVLLGIGKEFFIEDDQAGADEGGAVRGVARGVEQMGTVTDLDGAALEPKRPCSQRNS